MSLDKFKVDASVPLIDKVNLNKLKSPQYVLKHKFVDFNFKNLNK